jgi:hypothetical protein
MELLFFFLPFFPKPKPEKDEPKPDPFGGSDFFFFEGLVDELGSLELSIFLKFSFYFDD